MTTDHFDPDDTNCLEGRPPTPEERAAEWRELNRITPTPADKMALMMSFQGESGDPPRTAGLRRVNHLHRENGLPKYIVSAEGCAQIEREHADLLTMLKRVRKHGGIENLAQFDEMDELIARVQKP